jgi:hypothetical protein
MPRKDRRIKPQKITSDGTQSTNPNTLKSGKIVPSILDDVYDAIPDMVDSIMAKIDESNDNSLDQGNATGCQSKLEKEVSSIKNDVESIKFDVVEILRQLPPREKRKPDFLGDVLNNIFSGKMDFSDENVTFGGAPGNTKYCGTSYQTVPNTGWTTSIGKIEEASDSDSDSDSVTNDISDSDSDLD